MSNSGNTWKLPQLKANVNVVREVMSDFGDLSTLAPPPPSKNSVKVSMFRFCFILFFFCMVLNPTCLNWMVQLVSYKNHSGFKMVFVYEKG